jgi:uncharacterized protein (TIGR00251 family)
VILNVRVIPRASRSAVAGKRGDALLVRLSAPPVDGAANEALVEFLAKTFGRPRRNDKRVEIEGLSDDELASRLSAILNDAS